MPSESRTQMTVKIPSELHVQMLRVVKEEKYPSMSAVIISALEKEFLEPLSITSVVPGTDKELLKVKEELLKKDSENAVLLANYQGIQNLIADKDDRTTELKEQIVVKDTQIAKLTETMNAQAVHIQTLINQKQIEAQGAKKPWWKIW